MNSAVDSVPPPNRAESILIAALDHAPEDREAFLLIACGEDAALKAEVLTLLAAHEGAPAGFLSEGAGGFDVTMKMSPGTLPSRVEAVESEGERIGPYKLREQIGEGGFDTVWVTTARPGL